MTKPKTVQKSIHMPAALVRKLERLSKADRRTFSMQVVIIIEEWLEAIKGMKK